MQSSGITPLSLLLLLGCLHRDSRSLQGMLRWHTRKPYCSSSSSSRTINDVAATAVNVTWHDVICTLSWHVAVVAIAADNACTGSVARRSTGLLCSTPCAELLLLLLLLSACIGTSTASVAHAVGLRLLLRPCCCCCWRLC
jgi:hypothetical protein